MFLAFKAITNLKRSRTGVDKLCRMVVENAQRAPLAPAASKIVNLNVGGTIFSTSRETLNAGGDSFFASLISENFKVERDQHNNIFIDRDPKLFSAVLNFLRNQCTHLSIDRCNRAKLQSLQAEAEFYAVLPLIDECQRRLDELDEEDKKRDEERSRHKIHKRFAHVAPVAPVSRQASQASEPGSLEPPSEHAQARAEDGVVQEAADDEEGEGMEQTPLTQGRYVERTHAGLISDAARHMDMDF